MQEYSKGLEELTGLKKTTGAQILQISRLEQQLEAEKTRNGQLAKQNKIMQQKMSDTNKKYLQIQQQQLQLTELYDTQIVELKSLVERKSVELERISMNILPKFDQDMIRIKLLNELELPHRQQIEAKDDQIRKQQAAILDLQKRVELQNAKTHNLQEQHKKELQQMKNFHNSELAKLTRELQDAVQKQNSSKDIIRQAKRQTQQTRSRLSSFKKTYEQKIEDLQNQRHQNANAYKHQMEINNFKKDIDHLKIQLRDSKEQNNRMFRELQKSRDDYAKLAIKWQQQEIIISELKLKEKDLQMHEEDISKQSTQIDSLKSALKAKTRQIENAKEQNLQDNKKIKLLEKDLARARELTNDRKAQIEVIPQSVFPGSTHKSTDDAKLLNQITKLKSENEFLTQRLAAKQKELQNTLSQMEKFRKRHITPDKQKSLNESSKIQVLKEKLKQANEKIVGLIKDKIQMGRRLSPPPR